MYTKAGYSNGRMIPAGDTTVISGSNLGIHGTDFNSYELDVRDTDTLLMSHRCLAPNTSGGGVLSGQSLVFNYSFSPNNEPKQSFKIWNQISAPATTFGLAVYGSANAVSNIMSDTQLFNVQSVGWVRIESIKNQNLSTNCNGVQVYYGKSW
jgi:hypothetical protein